MVVLLHIFWYPADFCCSSLANSSIRLAYYITDNTPPCRILSLICSVPYFALTFAVRLLFGSFTIFQFFPSSPFLCTVYIIAFSQALSYALVTSRNAMYRFCFFFLLLWFIMLFRILMWSAVDFPAWPPAWASVILISSLMRLFQIFSPYYLLR